MKDKHKDKDDKTRNGFVNVTDNNNSSKGVVGDDFHNGEIVNYLTAAALVVGGGPAQTNGSNKQIIKSLCRPLHVVPKWAFLVFFVDYFCFFFVWLGICLHERENFSARGGKQILWLHGFILYVELEVVAVLFHIYYYVFQNYSSRLEVTYANNNTLIKKYENMPSIERPTSSPTPSETNSSSEEKSTTTKKKANGIRKVFSERSKSLISSGGGKQKINTDSYF